MWNVIYGGDPALFFHQFHLFRLQDSDVTRKCEGPSPHPHLRGILTVNTLLTGSILSTLYCFSYKHERQCNLIDTQATLCDWRYLETREDITGHVLQRMNTYLWPPFSSSLRSKLSISAEPSDVHFPSGKLAGTHNTQTWDRHSIKKGESCYLGPH